MNKRGNSEKPKIPDWWRCKNCRFWMEFRDGVGWCNNEEVERSIGEFVESETSLYRILFEGKGFGCIHFKSRDKSDED